MSTENQTAQRLPAFTIVWLFFNIGIVAFGGLSATLAVMRRELVARRELFTDEQLAEALTFTKPLPGSTAVQVVSYLGFRLGGWRGSVSAALAFLTPPFLAMVLMAALYERAHQFSQFASALSGLVAAVVGLMFTTTVRLAQVNAKSVAQVAIAVAAFASAVTIQVNVALIVVAAGLLGLAVCRMGGK